MRLLERAAAIFKELKSDSERVTKHSDKEPSPRWGDYHDQMLAFTGRRPDLIVSSRLL